MNNLICILEDNETYGLVVFDKKENQTFKTSDKVADFCIEEYILLYKIYLLDYIISKQTTTSFFKLLNFY
jgi:hypothetical protein